MRMINRLGIMAGVATAALLGSAVPALAATSEQAAPSGVGYVWYNAGTSNMAKGRNSFTVKDDHCGDGYKTFVYYEIYDHRSPNGSGGYNYSDRLINGQVIAEDCREVSISVYGPPATTDYIRWVPAKKKISNGNESYGFWEHDSVW